MTDFFYKMCNGVDKINRLYVLSDFNYKNYQIDRSQIFL